MHPSCERSSGCNVAIDDDEALRALYETILSGEDKPVYTFSSPPEFVKNIRNILMQGPIHAIVLDQELGNGCATGCSFANRLRRSKLFNKTRIIIVSGRSRGEIERALPGKDIVDDIVQKPFDAVELAEIVLGQSGINTR